MVLNQFQSRCKLPICCAFLSLKQISCKNMCSMRWWFLAYLFISIGTWIFALLYLFVSLLVEDSLPFTEMINSFYSPVLLSISILFFCQLFSYSLIISFVKTILHNLHHEIPNRKNFTRNVCPLPFDEFSSYLKETFWNQVLYPSCPQPSIYFSG